MDKKVAKTIKLYLDGKQIDGSVAGIRADCYISCLNFYISSLNFYL